MPSIRVRYKGELLHHNGVPWPQPADAPPQVASAVQRAMQSLKPFQREIIARRFWQGQDFRSIAQALESSPSDVRNCLRRTLRRLRSSLESDCESNKAQRSCVICKHPRRMEIERLLAMRRPHDTWRGYMTALRVQFGIARIPPKAVEAHLKLHGGGQSDGHT